jgi:hypothetical protein
MIDIQMKNIPRSNGPDRNVQMMQIRSKTELIFTPDRMHAIDPSSRRRFMLTSMSLLTHNNKDVCFKSGIPLLADKMK